MSERPFILIIEDKEELEIKPRLHYLQQAADHGDDLYWNREGKIKVVSNAALKNALLEYADWKVTRTNYSPVPHIPAHVLSFRWDRLHDATKYESSIVAIATPKSPPPTPQG